MQVKNRLVQRELTSKLKLTIPFNTERKLVTVAYQVGGNGEGETVRLIVKGAPEYVVRKCTSRQTAKGELQAFNGRTE